MTAPQLLSNYFHRSPLQPSLPWGPPSTWTLPVYLISYQTYHMPTPSYHYPCPGPVLPLLVPLPPSTIQDWGEFTLTCWSMFLLEGCPDIPALDAPPMMPPPVRPWVLHQAPLDTTKVYSSTPIPWTLALMNRLQRLVLNAPTKTMPPSCGQCMWMLSELHLPSTPLQPSVFTTPYLNDASGQVPMEK